MVKYTLEEFTASQISDIIDDHIHNRRHRAILKLRFIDGLTYDEIAQNPEVQRTARQVGAIIRKCAPKLKTLLSGKTS